MDESGRLGILSRGKIIEVDSSGANGVSSGMRSTDGEGGARVGAGGGEEDEGCEEEKQDDI